MVSVNLHHRIHSKEVNTSSLFFFLQIFFFLWSWMHARLYSVSAGHAGLVCLACSPTTHSVIRSNQNLLVALSVISVAQPIDNRIDATGDKREQRSRVVYL